MIARRLQLAPWLTFLFPPRRRYRAAAHRAAARPLRPDVVNALTVDATRQANESNGRIGNDRRHRCTVRFMRGTLRGQRLCGRSCRGATTRCGRSPAGTPRAGRRARRSRGHPERHAGSPILGVMATSATLVVASTRTTPPTEHGVMCAADAPHDVAPRALRDYSMIELQGNLALWNRDRPSVP